MSSLNVEMAKLMGVTPTHQAGEYGYWYLKYPDGHVSPKADSEEEAWLYVVCYDSCPEFALQALVYTMSQEQFFYAKIEMQASPLFKIADTVNRGNYDLGFTKQVEDDDKVKALCASIATVCRDALTAWNNSSVRETQKV